SQRCGHRLPEPRRQARPELLQKLELGRDELALPLEHRRQRVVAARPTVLARAEARVFERAGELLASHPEVLLPAVEQTLARILGDAIDEEEPVVKLVALRARRDEPLIEGPPAAIGDLVGNAPRIGVRRIDAGGDELRGGEPPELPVEVAGARQRARAEPVVVDELVTVPLPPV